MKPLVLCILDGVGIRKETYGNAVYKANMPVLDRILNDFPSCLLEASGEAVGLPKGQMGNSEVGHTNIGAGRVIYQPLELINQKISSKEFYQNKKILDIIKYTKENNSKLHLMGLLSDGGIHSHINHLFALLDMCKENGVKEVYLHMFLDGRDTLPTEGLKYLNQLNDKIKEIGIGKICTLSGRYYAMDRDNNYGRVKKAYDAIVNGEGEHYSSYEDAIKANLDKDITDEFTVPCVIEEGKVENKDGIIVFNFRPDRLREICASLTNPDFTGFPHENLNVKLATMMPISDEAICTSIYDNEKLENTFGEYISKKGLKQLRIAETEKYAHVTYFFDGGLDIKLKGSKRTLIPSPKVATYDLKPEMSARRITSSLIKQMDKYDVVILNFANGDMVGHTGNMDATISALEVIDECLGRINEKVKELEGILVITADHGNSDYMLDKDGNKVTSHSTAKVPFVITTDKDITLRDGKLADIAPTLLTIMGLDVPDEMTGDCLIVKKQNKKDKKKKNKKEKKDISSFEKIFRIVSIIFIIGFFSIYSYRFIHFYRLSHTKDKYVETNILKKLNTYEIKTSGSGLHDCTTSKCFKGLVDNNYLYYKGNTWRIVSFTDDSVKLISDESLTTLMANYNNNDYISKWLDSFKNKIGDDDYIKNMSLISSNEYTESMLGDSYLNNNTNWYTSDGKYINKDGKLKDNDNNSYGVRVVIEIGTDPIIISGTGTSTNPYQIVNDKPFKLADVNIGTYVNFSDYLWRVIDIDDTGIKLALEDTLDSKYYSTKNASYNTDEKGSVGNYLNNDFYNKLDKTYIKEATWNIIGYNTKNSFDYGKVQSTIKANVGLLNVGDLYINDLNGYVLMTEENTSTLYKVNPQGLLYLDLKKSSRKIRPAIYIDKDLVIGEGSGYKNSPYKIGE